jgi:hypothetical protein
MRKTALFQTAFWQRAYDSLPPAARERHAAQLAAAERWELALDGAIEAWSRLTMYFAPRRVQPH